MFTVHYRGRSPAQLGQIALWKFCRALSQLWLNVARSRIKKAEARYCLRNQGDCTLGAGERARAILTRHPEAHAAILSIAELVVEDQIEVPGFGCQRLDWQNAAATLSSSGCSAEEIYAQRLFLRLDFLRPLLQAHILSPGRQVYRQAVCQHVQEYAQLRNSARSWDSLDDAIRILNLLEIQSYLSEELPPEVREALRRAILQAAWNVEARRARTGNHLIYEALALFAAGSCFPQAPRSLQRRKLGQRLLETAMQSQVCDDGMHGELCSSYHLITSANFLKAAILAQLANQKFSKIFQQRLLKMAQVAAQLRAVDAGFLALGDSDRMLGDSREECEARAVAELGELLQDGNSESQISLDLDWLLQGIDVSALRPPPQESTAPLARFGGYCLVRPNREALLCFDAGNFGLAGAAHHAHADSLAFEWHLKGVRFLVDPGGFSYVDPAAREYARSTLAHNTAALESANSSRVGGAFDFGAGARVKLLQTEAISDGFLLLAEHDGFAKVLHQRGLIYLTEAPETLVVLDSLSGTGRCSAVISFHADADWRAQITASDSVLWQQDNLRIKQRLWANAPLNLMIEIGNQTPVWQGFIAPRLGEYLPAPVLLAACTGKLPINAVTVFSEAEEIELEIIQGLARGRVLINCKPRCSWEWQGGKIRVLNVLSQPCV